MDYFLFVMPDAEKTTEHILAGIYRRMSPERQALIQRIAASQGQTIAACMEALANDAIEERGDAVIAKVRESMTPFGLDPRLETGTNPRPEYGGPHHA